MPRTHAASSASPQRPRRAGWSHPPTAVVRVVAAGLLTLFLGVMVPSAPASAAEGWLDRLNAARAAAGLEPVVERGDWSRSAEEHARYILRHGLLQHLQNPGLADASPTGDWAARTGNLYRAGGDPSPTRAIHAWLNSPNHARWILDPGLAQVGFGDHQDVGADTFTYAAVLPVLDGIDRSVREEVEVRYPGDGATLRTYPAEGASATVTTVHLLRADLAAVAESQVRARVRVDGEERELAQVQVGDGHLAVVVAAPLPADGEVDVRLVIDGLDDAAWSFTLSSSDAAPPPNGAPSLEASAEVEQPASDDAARRLELTDIAGTVHEPAIRRMAEAELLRGFADGSFRPDQPVTRGQFSSLLLAVLEELGQVSPEAGSSSTPSDVADTTHATAIRAVIAAGWVNGYPDGTFRPDEPVTRGQLGSILTGALELPSAPGATTAFTDTAGSAHARGITALASAELVSGFSDGTFRPERPVSRGQLASILAEVLDPAGVVSS